MTLDRVRWPALIGYAGDAELAWVESAAAWLDDADYHAFDYAAEDVLIDSAGARFSLTTRVGGRVVPKPLGAHIDPAELSSRLRAHCAAIGVCCVARLSASSPGECIAIVAELRDD